MTLSPSPTSKADSLSLNFPLPSLFACTICNILYRWLPFYRANSMFSNFLFKFMEGTAWFHLSGRLVAILHSILSIYSPKQQEPKHAAIANLSIGIYIHTYLLCHVEFLGVQVRVFCECRIFLSACLQLLGSSVAFWTASNWVDMGYLSNVCISIPLLLFAFPSD